MTAPLLYKTRFPQDCSAASVYAKIPPIPSSQAETDMASHNGVSAGDIEFELEGPVQGRSQAGDAERPRDLHREATELVCSLMALNNRDLDLLVEEVKDSDFYVKAGVWDRVGEPNARKCSVMRCCVAMCRELHCCCKMQVQTVACYAVICGASQIQCILDNPAPFAQVDTGIPAQPLQFSFVGCFVGCSHA